MSKLFLDPSGHHILISLAPKTSGLASELLYIHDNGPKVRRIEKFKELEVTAVAFNVIVGNEYTTGPILLGTQKGLLFETELALDGDKPSYKKQVGTIDGFSKKSGVFLIFQIMKEIDTAFLEIQVYKDFVHWIFTIVSMIIGL